MVLRSSEETVESLEPSSLMSTGLAILPGSRPE